MTLEQYKELTGLAVSSTNEVRVNAAIERTQMILEDMLGYTLDTDLTNDNFYNELGKTQSECPCPLTEAQLENLDSPDTITTAYRVFNYNKHDVYLPIDPCTAIHKVKLVNGRVTYRTLPVEEYRLHAQRGGIVKYLQQLDCYCRYVTGCSDLQLAVDADWLWESFDAIPVDLKHVWVEMVTYYADDKSNIKSETLGPHSYTKFDKTRPEIEEYNLAVIKKYAGAWGSASNHAIV